VDIVEQQRLHTHTSAGASGVYCTARYPSIL
jgi:hypothetical protein